MATLKTPLVSAQSTWTAVARFRPQSPLVTRRIKAGTAATFLPGTLFTIDTTSTHEGKVVPYTDTLGVFHCILFPQEATRDATDDVMATFMIDGTFHIDDIPIVNKAGVALTDVTLAAIKTNCKKVLLQQLGFHVDGLLDAI